MPRRSALAFLTLTLLAQTPSVRYVDIAGPSGVILPNTYGGPDSKDTLLETTGSGAAIFDYDGDGANDIFIANGAVSKPGAPPTRSHLYRNDGKGRFTELGREAGLTRSGWAQAACAGDYDNDGRPDLLATYYGPNILYRNTRAGKFADVTQQARLPVTGTRWSAGTPLSTTTATATSTYSSPTTWTSTSPRSRSPAAASIANGRAWPSPAALADSQWPAMSSTATTTTARSPMSPKKPAFSPPAGVSASA